MQLQLAAISPVFFAVLATATVIPPSWSMPAARLSRRQGKDLADFNKPPKILNTNPLEVDMNWEFAGMLKPVGVSNVREWPREEWNYPSQCVEEVKFEWNTGTCNLANMKVMDVTYEDCPEPWTLCYCEGSELSKDDFINFVGQFPVRTRDVLRHGVSLPPNGKTGAYLRYPDLTLTGSGMQEKDGQKRLHFFLIFHELGHLLDRGASSSEDYFKAIESDSCILRDTPNLVENFGNLGPMIAAKHVNEGRYNQIYNDLGLDCLSNQLAFAEAQMGELLTWGGTCTERLSPNFDVVNIPNGVLTKRDLESSSSGLVERASICHNYASSVF